MDNESQILDMEYGLWIVDNEKIHTLLPSLLYNCEDVTRRSSKYIRFSVVDLHYLPRYGYDGKGNHRTDGRTDMGQVFGTLSKSPSLDREV